MKRDEHRNGTLVRRRLAKIDNAALNLEPLETHRIQSWLRQHGACSEATE